MKKTKDVSKAPTATLVKSDVDKSQALLLLAQQLGEIVGRHLREKGQRPPHSAKHPHH